MKLAHKVRGGHIFRLQPHVFFFAIMMMAMPAFAEEISLPAREIQVSPEISVKSLGTNSATLTYTGKDGLVVTITSESNGVLVETATPTCLTWVEAKTNASSRYARSENRLVVTVGTNKARLTAVRVPKQKKGTMNLQAEMPVRTTKEVSINKMAGHFLVSVMARLEEAVCSGRLETAPESADMLVLKRDIQVLMAQPLETVYRTPRKKAASAAASSK